MARYADLSDFFYVWLRRALCDFSVLPQESLTPKQDECIVDEAKGQGAAYFERCMAHALREGRRATFILSANSSRAGPLMDRVGRAKPATRPVSGSDGWPKG